MSKKTVKKNNSLLGFRMMLQREAKGFDERSNNEDLKYSHRLECKEAQLFCNKVIELVDKFRNNEIK